MGIQIKNDSDRLSEDQIEAMIKEAEINKAKDEILKRTVTEKNNLEQVCYQAKQQLDDSKLKDKFTDEDRKKINDPVTPPSDSSKATLVPLSKSTSRRPRSSTLFSTPSCRRSMRSKEASREDKCPPVVWDRALHKHLSMLTMSTESQDHPD